MRPKGGGGAVRALAGSDSCRVRVSREEGDARRAGPACRRQRGGGADLGRERKVGRRKGGVWAAGEEKEREREVGWAGWAEKQREEKEESLHFF